MWKLALRNLMFWKQKSVTSPKLSKPQSLLNRSCFWMFFSWILEVKVCYLIIGVFLFNLVLLLLCLLTHFFYIPHMRGFPWLLTWGEKCCLLTKVREHWFPKFCCHILTVVLVKTIFIMWQSNQFSKTAHFWDLKISNTLSKNTSWKGTLINAHYLSEHH